MKLEQHYRFQKIFTDNFYLLDIKDNKYNCIFKLSGSTQNIYTVRILKNDNKNHICCDCPDMKKCAPKHGVLCKHIIFIIFKVLKLFNYKNKMSQIIIDNDGGNFLETKILLKENIEVISVFIDIFNYNDSDIVNKDYRDKFNKMTKNNDSISFIDNNSTCVICFDCFECKDSDFISKCSRCVGIFHKECLQKWLNYNNTCPYCRSKIETENLYKKIL